MTGAPAFEHLTSKEGIWDLILEADQRNYIMAAGVPDGSKERDEEKHKELGLVEGHAYGLIAAMTVTDRFGDEVNILKLRNPWGSFEWKGAWSDTSDCWTPELQEQVDLQIDAQDGTFWMSEADFVQYFSRVQICKYVDGFQFNSNRFDWKQDGYYFVKVEITRSGT